jgi:hypothetical protein
MYVYKSLSTILSLISVGHTPHVTGHPTVAGMLSRFLCAFVHMVVLSAATSSHV